MLGAIVNTAAIAVGGVLGTVCGGRIDKRISESLMAALAIITGVLGVGCAVKSADTLCLIVCTALGTVLGELLRIDDFIERLGEAAQKKLSRGQEDGKPGFSHGFVTATVVFCVGSMAVMGSIAEGVRGDPDILLTKSVIDFVGSIAFAAAMGIGVAGSAACILVCEGGMTLAAGALGGLLNDIAVTEMSAVGGVLLIGTCINLLGLRKERIKVANLLPGIFLPLAYIPLTGWLTGVLG